METFIVRVWTPSPDLVEEIAVRELHGRVEHVRSRYSDWFRTSDELLELLRSALDGAGGETTSGSGPEPP